MNRYKNKRNKCIVGGKYCVQYSNVHTDRRLFGFGCQVDKVVKLDSTRQTIKAILNIYFVGFFFFAWASFSSHIGPQDTISIKKKELIFDVDADDADFQRRKKR